MSILNVFEEDKYFKKIKKLFEFNKKENFLNEFLEFFQNNKNNIYINDNLLDLEKELNQLINKFELLINKKDNKKLDFDVKIAHLIKQNNSLLEEDEHITKLRKLLNENNKKKEK